MGMASGMDPSLMGLLGGVAVGSLMGGMQRTPSLPTPATPVAPPQPSQVPDASTTLSKVMGTGQAGGSPGIAQTFLTGPGGVDPSKLNLNKHTLLGA